MLVIFQLNTNINISIYYIHRDVLVYIITSLPADEIFWGENIFDITKI